MNHRRQGEQQVPGGSTAVGIPRRRAGGLVTVGRLGAVGAVILSAVAVGVGQGVAQVASAKTMAAVSISLDWTPNADNEGVFVAQKLGYFASAGLSVTIVPYGKTSPDTLVASGRTNFAIAATEGDALEDFAQGNPVTSVMAIVQRDPNGARLSCQHQGRDVPGVLLWQDQRRPRRPERVRRGSDDAGYGG